jgi:hypothetical protein
MRATHSNAVRTVILVVVIGVGCLVAWLPGQPRQRALAQDAQPPLRDLVAKRENTPTEKAVKMIMTAKPLEAATGDDAVKKLLKERYNTAVRVLTGRWAYYEDGRIPIHHLAEAVFLIRDSRMELDEGPVDFLVVLGLALDLAKEREAAEEGALNRGTGSVIDVEIARYNRLGAEIQLLRAKQKSKSPPAK